MKILPAQPGDLERIRAAARADNHPVFAPTHFLQNEAGEVRGYYSAGGVTFCPFWSHTENDKFASFRLLKSAIASSRLAQKPVLTFCAQSSPFKDFMPELGFNFLGTSGFYELL